MPGSSFHPLELHGENCEAHRFRRSARNGDALDELIGLVLLDTGIRTGEMAHMNRDWRVYDEEGYGIRIPLEAKCRIGAGPIADRVNTHKKGEICRHCRTQPEKWWTSEDAEWRPKTKSAHRFIPIREDDTQRVVHAYFDLNDRVVTHQTILKRVRKIGERADIPRRIRPNDLRNTYGTNLADKGFTAHEIKNLMGHATVEPATHYIKLSSKSMHDTFDDKW